MEGYRECLGVTAERNSPTPVRAIMKRQVRAAHHRIARKGRLESGPAERLNLLCGPCACPPAHPE
eukprot:1296663-Rhodomonas_salina.1